MDEEGNDNEEYQFVEVYGSDDDDPDYAENDAEGGQDESMEDDDNEEDEDDENEGENMAYQPTNPMHYLRMIRQILTGHQDLEEPEEEEIAPPQKPLTDERIVAEIVNDTRVGHPSKQCTLQSIPSMLLNRELCRNGSLSSPHSRVHLSHRFIPKAGWPLFQYEHQIFCGQYSRDGSLFMSAAQDRRVRLYDSVSWKTKKEIHARNIEWSIIDIDYSPDQRWIIYSSWSDYVHMCNLQGDFEIHDALDFSPEASRFCLFSIKFSPDSTEILGGSSDRNIYLYDINRKERVVQVKAHSNDINTVCYLDPSGNLIASGSDDFFVKIWDRRILSNNSSNNNNNNESSNNDSNNGKKSVGCVGLLPGHVQGITHLDPKGDGRHLISNGKDQCIKLWDLRNMADPTAKIRHPTSSRGGYDYRYSTAGRNSVRHQDDKSIQTYQGHRVFQTLIRAYFSPASTTGQKYIYSGSYDGCIYIYDVLTGDLVKKLSGHRKLIRDVSWHPYDMQIVSTSWDGSIWKWDLQDRDPLSLPPASRNLRSYWDY